MLSRRLRDAPFAKPASPFHKLRWVQLSRLFPCLGARRKIGLNLLRVGADKCDSGFHFLSGAERREIGDDFIHGFTAFERPGYALQKTFVRAT